MTTRNDEFYPGYPPDENDYIYEGSFSDLLASLNVDLGSQEPEAAVDADGGDFLSSILSELYPQQTAIEPVVETAPASAAQPAQEPVAAPVSAPAAPAASAEPAAQPVPVPVAPVKQSAPVPPAPVNQAHSPEAAAPAVPIDPAPQVRRRPLVQPSEKTEKAAAPARERAVRPEEAKRPATKPENRSSTRPSDPASAQARARKPADASAKQGGAKKPQSPASKQKQAADGKKPKPKKPRIAPEDVYNEENWAPYDQRLKKSRRVFTIAMAIYAVVFIGLAVLGVVLLNGYMNSYEQSRPEYYMEALMPTMTVNDWYNVMLANAHIEANEFESIDDVYEAYYNAIVTSDEVSYRKKVGLYSDETPVYAVRIGDIDIVNVYLYQDESADAGYGFKYWKLDYVEALADGTGLTCSSIEIDAPADVGIYLNGKLLSSDYIVADDVTYTLSELESRFDTQPYKVKYRVDGMFLNYELRDDAGNLLEAYDQVDSTLYYNIDQAERWSFKVTAMSDMTVTVNGAVLNNDDASSTDPYIVLDGISELGRYIDEIPTVNTWSYSNLLTQPVITCTDAYGNELTPEILEDGTYVFSYLPSSEAEESYRSRALGFLNAYIKYAVDDKNNTDSNYYKLVGYVLDGSELKTYFYSSWLGGMHWGGIKDYELHEVNVSNFIMHGDTCFSCTGYFSITQETYYETREYETTYTLVFVKSGNSWYVVRMDDSNN